MALPAALALLAPADPARDPALKPALARPPHPPASTATPLPPPARTATPLRPSAETASPSPPPVAPAPSRPGAAHPPLDLRQPASSGNGARAPVARPPRSITTTSAAVYGDSWLQAARLTMRGVRFHGTATPPTAHGPPRHLKLTMSGGQVIDGDHRFARPGGPAAHQRFSSLTLSGGVVLYATRLRFRVGGVGLTLTPATPSPPPLPAVTVTDVEADGLLIHTTRAHVAGLAQHAPA